MTKEERISKFIKGLESLTRETGVAIDSDETVYCALLTNEELGDKYSYGRAEALRWMAQRVFEPRHVPVWRVLIGRSRNADISFPHDPSVAELHAVVERAENGEVVLTAFSTTHGVRVKHGKGLFFANGERVGIHPGCVLIFGNSDSSWTVPETMLRTVDVTDEQRG